MPHNRSNDKLRQCAPTTEQHCDITPRALDSPGRVRHSLDMSFRVSSDVARKLMWDALLEADGNRTEAAKKMGLSLRSFYRYLQQLGMYADLDKMGWTKQRGPERSDGSSEPSRIDELICALMDAGDVPLDIPQTALKMYGEDTRSSRMKVHAGLSYLKQRGRVRRVERGKWVFVK